MPEQAAYLLVAHGSRDPRSQRGLERLAEQFRHRLAGAGHTGPVAIATLEFGPPLAQTIYEWGARLVDAQISQLRVIPLFLLPGAHVRVDLPAAIAAAQAQLPTAFTLTFAPYLGAHPDMPALLQEHMSPADQPWILMAHGSRYPGGNQAIIQLAEQLGATPAFWAVAPSLEQVLEPLIHQNHSKIGIFSYFLFAGGITDTILAKVNALRLRFNKNELTLMSLLDAGPTLANLLMTYTDSDSLQYGEHLRARH